MRKIWLGCALVLILGSGCLGLPQGRVERRQQQVTPVAATGANLDPNAADAEGANDEDMKQLIEKLQRLKRTLDTVKERVGKGSYGESSDVDMKNPEGAILTVLKSLQEQGQLFAMINDMLKAGSEVQNQTEKIKEHSKLQAETIHAENTNQLTSVQETTKARVANQALPSSLPTPSVGPADLTGPMASPSISSTSRRGVKQRDDEDPSKMHGYDDYQYQYSDDSGNSSGDNQYDYHYDAQGYDAPRSSSRAKTTTSTTTNRPSSRRMRGRSRSDYY